MYQSPEGKREGGGVQNFKQNRDYRDCPSERGETFVEIGERKGENNKRGRGPIIVVENRKKNVEHTLLEGRKGKHGC